jgi:predicted Zn-dependent protease with MMP-like domain
MDKKAFLDDYDSRYNKGEKISMDFLAEEKIQKLWRKKAGEVPSQSVGQPGFSRGRRFFEELVREAIEALPKELRSRLENVAIIVEEEPPARTRKRGGNRQELLGLYHGISQKDRGFWYGNVLPDRIIIYRKPLERISVGSGDLKENVRQTVVHEVGHYFGFDEDDLQRLEEEGF